MQTLKGKKSAKYLITKKIWKHRSLNERRELLLKALIPSSVLFLLSLFSGSYKILGLGSIQYVLIVFLNIAYMSLARNVKAKDLVEYTKTESKSLFEKGKIVRSIVYGSATPAMVIGIITILIMITVCFFK